MFEHETKSITYPSATKPVPQRIVDSPHVTAFFDGGAASRLGTGGFIIFAGTGECVQVTARYYGEEFETNNKTEARALQELITWLAKHKEKWAGAGAVVIFGDS